MVSLNTRDACLVLNTDMGEAKEEEHTSIKHTYKKAHIAPAQIPQHFNQPPTAGADIPALHGEVRQKELAVFHAQQRQQVQTPQAKHSPPSHPPSITALC